MVQFIGKHTMRCFLLALEEEALGKYADLDYLALEIYKKQTKEVSYRKYICSTCNQEILRRTPYSNLSRCKQVSKKGICYATRKKWEYVGDVKRIEFHTSGDASTYRTNLRRTWIKELVDLEIISLTDRKVKINYNALLKHLFEQMHPKALGSWYPKIEWLVRLHFSNLVKNNELCARIYYYPFRLLFGFDSLGYEAYRKKVIGILSMYDAEKTGFSEIINNNFNLSTRERKELLSLQDYCFRDKIAREADLVACAKATWGVTDTDKYKLNIEPETEA